MVSLETGEEGLLSLAPKHNETRVKDLCNYYYTTNSDDIRGKATCQSTASNETEASSCSSLMDLIEQYKSEKLHFESVSMRHADVLTAFTGSYKILESLRDTSHNLSKPLTEVENQVKLYEAKTSEFAASLEEVCGEMTKSQNKMVETARRVVKELSGKLKGARK